MQVGWITALKPLLGVVAGLGIVLISKVFGGARPSFEKAHNEECQDDGDEKQQHFIPTTFVSDEECHVREVTAASGYVESGACIPRWAREVEF